MSILSETIISILFFPLFLNPQLSAFYILTKLLIKNIIKSTTPSIIQADKISVPTTNAVTPVPKIVVQRYLKLESINEI